MENSNDGKDDRKREKTGEYVEEYEPDTVLGAFEQSEIPVLTSRRVSEIIGCSQRTARRKLAALDDERGDGTLIRVPVGDHAVWYLPNENENSEDSQK